MAESVAKIESQISETFLQTSVGLGLALGSRLGLFTAIAAIATDLWTPADLARATGCKERYILEWLGLMASAGLIKIDNQTDKYYVTAGMKSCLNGNAITGCMFLPAFFHAFPHITDCFKLNGPNESGIIVADLGCGSGRLAIALAERFPNSQIYGLDSDEQAVELGRKRGQEKDLKNLHMFTQDVHNLPVDYKDKFDVVIAMYVIHDLPFPKRALEQVHFVLKPTDGVLCMIENNVSSGQKYSVTQPETRGMYAFSIFNCVPNAMKIDGGTALGACAGRQVMSEYAMRAGFKDISYKTTKLISDGIIIVCWK